MKIVTCTRFDHQKLGRDPHRLPREATYIGIQLDGDGSFLELWNHIPCGSTFARTPPPGSAHLEELQLLAERHAEGLKAGEVIDDEDRYVLPFMPYLPAAIARRDMALERLPGGWRVVDNAPDVTPTQPQLCSRCLVPARECMCLANALIR